MRPQCATQLSMRLLSNRSKNLLYQVHAQIRAHYGRSTQEGRHLRSTLRITHYGNHEGLRTHQVHQAWLALATNAKLCYKQSTMCARCNCQVHAEAACICC
jgi:hypothetical protein